MGERRELHAGGGAPAENAPAENEFRLFCRRHKANGGNSFADFEVQFYTGNCNMKI